MKDEGGGGQRGFFSSFIPPPSSLKLRGPLWMVVAGLLFSVMGLLVKLGARHFSGSELAFYRSLFGLVASYGIVRAYGGTVVTQRWRLHLWRGLSGMVALLLFFYGLAYLPLGTGVTLNYTSPLFLAALTVLLPGERPRWTLVLAVLLGFAGVVLLLRPTFAGGQSLAGLAGLTSGFFAAVAYLNVKQLGRCGEPPHRVVFYFTLISTLGCGFWMLGGPLHPLSMEQLPLLLALGTTATLAQLAMTRAYAEGDTLTVASLAYSAVVFSALLGALAWGDELPWQSWLGMGIVILAGVAGVRMTGSLPGNGKSPIISANR